jgi:two-component system response regulator DctR
MQPSQDAMVFIVDDDASVRDGLAWLLRSRHLPSQAFDSAEAFDAMLQRRVRADSSPVACCSTCECPA